jgi:alkanesulfonate monooxygenase SsuD/methylene tetrahydromethanopterin reductase-like flavin-dependent oxidoreductase (luciferase family)
VERGRVRPTVPAGPAHAAVLAGEHHSAEFFTSSSAVVLAAAAARTTGIWLTSATTLLGVADPVRVYEDFATLDVISRGRAEVIVGRSAFAEPFALFGYDTAD